MNRNIGIVAAIVIAFVVGISIFFSSGIVQETSQEPINLIMNVWPGYGYVVIADDRGLFEDNGVRVNLDIVEEYPDMIKDFLDGGYDGFFGVYSDAILLSNQGTALKVVYVVDYSSGGDVVVSKAAITTVADLKGKTVSVEEFNSFSHLFLLDLLRRNGLTEFDVNFVEIPAPQVVAALDSGVIAAGHTWEPTQSKAIAKGYRLLATSSETPGIITDVLAIKKSVLEDRSEAIRKVVKSLEEAHKFQNSDKNAALSIMSKRLGLTPAELIEVMEGLKQPDLEENKEAFTSSTEFTSLYLSGELISNIFEENGVITNPVDIEDILAPEIVNGIK